MRSTFRIGCRPSRHTPRFWIVYRSATYFQASMFHTPKPSQNHALHSKTLENHGFPWFSAYPGKSPCTTPPPADPDPPYKPPASLASLTLTHTHSSSPGIEKTQYEVTHLAVIGVRGAKRRASCTTAGLQLSWVSQAKLNSVELGRAKLS